MGRDLLRAEHMTVGYGNVPLLSEVELHVRQGEIVTLIGPNGAGKSTILKSKQIEYKTEYFPTTLGILGLGLISTYQ